MRLDLIGFAPDVDPATSGILTDCDGIIPTAKGLSAAHSRVNAGYPALATAPTSAFMAALLDGTKRTLVASDTAIYEASGGVWTNQSRVGGYTGSNRTRFCVFGNAVLSTNRSQAIGQSTGAAFTDIAGAPLARVIFTASGFVMALNINGMTLGDAPDAWGCSALRDQTDWTPSVTTQCAAGRLLDSPGPITAGAELGSDAVAYKDTSMYLGRYVGPPLVWSWQRVPGNIGCPGAESLVVVDTRHFFIGPNDIYVYDGTVPRSIGTPVREWFFANLHPTHRDKIIGVSDTARELVYWYYPSNASSGELDSVLVYNYRTDRWGKQSQTIQAAVQYSSGLLTYDDMGTSYATYEDIPAVAYDATFWLTDSTIPGVFQSNTLYSLTGTPGNTWWQTGDFGDMTEFSYLSRVTPRYRVKPETAVGTNYHRAAPGDSLTQDASVQMTRDRFDFRRSARWHQLRVDQVGSATVSALDVDLKPASRE